MAAARASEVRFEDVMVHFSTDELGMLEKWQRELYFDVLVENYEALIIVGNPATRSDVIEWFKQGERQNCAESQESRAADSPATGGGPGQIFSECYTETLEPPKMADGRSEEEKPRCGNPGRTPKHSCVPFMQQGSRLRDGCIPHLGKAAGGSASPTHSQGAARAPKPYECQECGSRFRLKGLLRIHQRVSLRKLSLPCPECGIFLPSHWHLKRHRRVHRRACADGGSPGCLETCQGSRVEERLHFCADCGESFCWYLDFLQHRKSHEEVEVWPCVQCDITFTYQSDLAMHEEGHLSEALGVCAPCGENCVCSRSFLYHFASELDKSVENSGTDPQEDERLPGEVGSEPEKPYACHQCGEQFRLEGNLGLHYRYCHKARLQKYRRSITSPGPQKDGGKQVRNRGVPVASRNGCSRPLPLPTSPARWTCSPCGKSFTSWHSLRKHWQRHGVEERQSAVEPDRSESAAGGFGGHALAGVMKKLHRCQECKKRFVFKWQLVTHLKVHAEGNRCWPTLSGGSSCHKGRLGKPLRIRSGKRPPSGRRREDRRVPRVATEPRGQGEEGFRPCADCGKSLKKSYLPFHQAWHAGVRYMCLLCGHVSNFKSGASRHLQQHRKREGFFTCPKCENGSQSKRCLCLIERIYLGQKPLPALYDGGKDESAHEGRVWQTPPSR